MNERTARQKGLTSEQQVVLACAHGRLTTGEAREVGQQVARGIDWNAAKDLAADFG